MQRGPDPIHPGTVDKETILFLIFVFFVFFFSSAGLAAFPPEIYDLFDSDFGQHLFYRKGRKILGIILYKGATHGTATKA